MAITDGSAGAPGVAPQLPNLLDGYATRPSWQVAGVDYGVGPVPGTVLRTPTANNLPVGATLENGAISVSGNNVTLSGYNLTGLTVMVQPEATGTVTVINCAATSGVNIRSTVDATANLVVQNCYLNGGYALSDPNFQVIKVWTPLTLEYSMVMGATSGVYVGGSQTTILYNVLQGFGHYGSGDHAGSIYITGTDNPNANTTIGYNTIYTEATRDPSWPVTGIGCGIAFFGDGGNFNDALVTNNTLISALPGGASYMTGVYLDAGYSTKNFTISNNYYASINGFNNANSGAFGAFYNGAAGAVHETFSGNVDMGTGMAIDGNNNETPISSGGGGGSTTPAAPKIATWSPDTGVSGDGITSANLLTLTGTAVAGSTVNLFDGSSPLPTVTADAKGSWTFGTAALADGVHAFTATDTVSSKTSAASAAVNVTVDTKGPAAPVEKSAVVNGALVTVTGSAEANSSVKILDGATPVGTATASGSGAWTIVTSALSVGTHSLTAVATDAAGNGGAASTAFSATIATPPPVAPKITGWSPDTGVSGDGITSAKLLKLTGTAAAGSTVYLFDGSNPLATVIADSTGGWTYTTAALTDGAHAFSASGAVTGLTSLASTAINVVVDTKAPGAPSETGVSVNGSQATVNGKAEVNSAIKLLDGAAVVGTGTADASGAWSIASSTLTTGAHSLTSTATDAAGNVSAASAALIATVSSVTTSHQVTFTSMSLQSNRTVTLTGSADAYSTVKVFDAGVLVGTTKAGSSGRWKLYAGPLGDGVQRLTAQEFKSTGAFVASTSGEAVLGTAGGDTLNSTSGDDLFYGAGSLDTYVFQAGFGHDVIADNGIGDTFFFAKSEFADFASLMSHTSQIGNDTVITSGSDRLTMANTPLSSLVASQFHFG